MESKLNNKENELKPKARHFANPTTADEAETKTPTMAELTAEIMIRTADGWKPGTKEEIMRRGSLLDKLKVYYCDRDLEGYTETERDFTREDFRNLKNSILSEEDAELVKRCVNEFRTITEFGDRLRYEYRRFQTYFSMLALLLNKLDSYETMVKYLNDVQSRIRERYGDIISKTEFTKDGWEDIQYPLNITALNGATLRKNPDNTFTLYTGGKGMLYDEICKGAKTAERQLKVFKAYVKAAQEYIAASALQYTPISIRMSIADAEEERYARYMVKNLSFFRSELNERKAMGEAITPEEEKRAFIPDYCEVKPNTAAYRNCKFGIKQIAQGYAT